MSYKDLSKEKMFSFGDLRFDLKASLIVFVVAVPLCLGIALSQGVSLFSGLLSGIIGGIVVGALSGSRLSISGPSAAITTIVLSSVADLGSFNAFLLALVIGGVFQIIFGVLKAGIIGHYFPTAVIKGMLAAIGVILIMKQLPHLLGYDKDPEGSLNFIEVNGDNTFSELINMVNFTTPGAMIIGGFSIVLMFLWGTKWIKNNKVLSAIPGPLLVVATAIGLNFLLKNFDPIIQIRKEHLVNMPDVGTWAKFTAELQFPDFHAITSKKVWIIGLMLGLISSLSSLLTVDAIDKLDPRHEVTPTNRELIAQGVGNIVCGLLGAIPVSSVIIRSSVNITAGARSRFSAIFHALLLAAAVFIMPGILEMIPLSALAAILIVIGLRLARPVLFINTFKSGWDQFIPFMVTLLVMLFTDLLRGVGAGIFVSILFILRQNYKNPFRLLEDTIDGRKHYFIRLSQYVTFVNKGKFIEFFRKVEPESRVEIDGGRSAFIDRDVLEAITEFKYSGKLRKIDVILEGIEEVEIISGRK
ncbi:MAG: SulP family inorganic anion transporter [Bacteroidia bacterium]|nr:SulP family inorganic anion transporter [Bacteroidia bacterium]